MITDCNKCQEEISRVLGKWRWLDQWGLYEKVTLSWRLTSSLDDTYHNFTILTPQSLLLLFPLFITLYQPLTTSCLDHRRNLIGIYHQLLLHLLLESRDPLPSTHRPGSWCLEQRLEQDTEVQQKTIALLKGRIKQQHTSRHGSGPSKIWAAQRAQEQRLWGFIPTYCRWLLFLEGFLNG